MNPPRFQRIGIIANLEKEGVQKLVNRIVREFLKSGMQVCGDPELAAVLDSSSGVELTTDIECDMFAVLGGDGTILMAARQYVEQETPILGIKAGHLGFLAVPPDADTVQRICAGRFQIQKRMRLRVRVEENGETVALYSALNDVVVHSAGSSRMVTLRTHIDGTFLREYSGDGVILATPTGSTAYSLSAGGPLLAPIMEAIVLTPLCPHMLSIRPIVLDATERIDIAMVAPRSEIRVTIDGQEGCNLSEGQHVTVEKSEYVTRLVVPEDYDFFSLLREKLQG